MNGSCDMDFDYNIWTSSVWKANLGGLIPCILAILSVGEAIQRLGRAPVASCCFTISLILCVVLGFVSKDEIVIWIGGCAQGFILAGLTTMTLFIVETYTTVIRQRIICFENFVCSDRVGNNAFIFNIQMYCTWRVCMLQPNRCYPWIGALHSFTGYIN